MQRGPGHVTEVGGVWRASPKLCSLCRVSRIVQHHVERDPLALEGTLQAQCMHLLGRLLGLAAWRGPR